jgi:aspartate/methionine/tyrosine aminotransferase
MIDLGPRSGLQLLGENAKLLCRGFSAIPELTVVVPKGAMYMMVRASAAVLRSHLH